MASGASALHCRLLFAKLQKLAIVKTCDGPAFPKQGVINIVMDDCKRRKRVAASEQLHNLPNFVIMTQIAEVHWLTSAVKQLSDASAIWYALLILAYIPGMHSRKLTS